MNWTEKQKACINMLEEWACGAHHLPKVHEFGDGVCVNFYSDLSTFDGSKLTSLVLLAHRDAIRIEISHSGPRMVKIIAHKRRHKHGPDDKARYYEYHPSLSDLVLQAMKMDNFNLAKGGDK